MVNLFKQGWNPYKCKMKSDYNLLTIFNIFNSLYIDSAISTLLWRQ